MSKPSPIPPIFTPQIQNSTIHAQPFQLNQIHPRHHAGRPWPLRRWPAHRAIGLDAVPENHGRQGPGAGNPARRLRVARAIGVSVAQLGGSRALGTEGITGDELQQFIDQRLFPALRDLPAHDPRSFMVREVFEGNNNYMKSGTSFFKYAFSSIKVT